MLGDRINNGECLSILLERNGYAVTMAKDETDACESLAQPSINVALLCLDLRREGYQEFLSVLKEVRPDLLLIIVADEHDYHIVSREYYDKVFDCLFLPFEPGWLMRILSKAFYVVKLNQDKYRMIGALKQAKETAERLASTDQLTNLANRDTFKRHLEEVIADVEKSQKAAGVLFIDLDGFKGINDTHGHLMGDLVLKEIARRLVDNCNSQDLVGRIGGDEFAIAISGLECQGDIWPKVAKIQKCLKKPLVINNINVDAGGSIGVSLCPEDGFDAEELIRRADVALYASKAEGRGLSNQFCISMDEQAQAQRNLDRNLEKAFLNNEFELFYQPQIELENRKLVGTEALLRWNSPELGMVTPDKFIAATEASGLIVELGEWIIRAACAQIKQWSERNEFDLKVAVNLSVRQFRDSSVIKGIKKTLQEFDIDPSKLGLEITESTVSASEDLVSSQLEKLRELGFSISLDDFGTGFSSLTRLKNYPIDNLKIDRSFVNNVISDDGDRFICMSTLQLAKNLGLKTVAEGIESQDQLDYFHSMGCDQVQGYFYSKPLAIKDFENWARRFQWDNQSNNVVRFVGAS